MIGPRKTVIIIVPNPISPPSINAHKTQIMSNDNFAILILHPRSFKATIKSSEGLVGKIEIM